MQSLHRFFDNWLAPPKSYADFFSYFMIILTATWAFCICYDPDDDFRFCYGGFVIVFFEGLVGLSGIIAGNGPWKNNSGFIREMLSVLALPLILVDLFIDYGFCYELCYIHLLYPIIIAIPILFPIRRIVLMEAKQLVIFMSDVSLLFIGFVMEKRFNSAFGAAVCHGLAHFVIGVEGRKMDLRSADFFNYAICAFVFFVTHSVLCGLKSLDSVQRHLIRYCKPPADVACGPGRALST